MKIEAVDSPVNAARAAFRFAMGMAKETTSVSGRRAELIRSCVWAHCSASAKPVRTVRVTSLATALSEPWACEDVTEDERECLRQTLKELGVLGDLIPLSGGFWTPGPLQIVSLGAATDRALLVGGVPTRLLPKKLQAGISVLGLLRRVTGKALRNEEVEAWLREVGYRTMTLDEWSEVPSEPLSQWGEGVLSSRFIGFPDSGEGLRVFAYLPSPRRTKGPARPQIVRWGSLPNSLDSKRHLVRLERVAQFRDEYFLAEVSQGRILRTGPVLRGGDHRRLMYYLDSKAGEPTTAEFRPSQGGGGALLLRSELPPQELRKFSALGILHQEANQKYYPRVWKIEESELGDALKVLNGLGIKVIQHEI